MVFARYTILPDLTRTHMCLLDENDRTNKLNPQAETIKFALEQQMVFFARLVGHFEVADDITPIKIENFD